MAIKRVVVASYHPTTLPLTRAFAGRCRLAAIAKIRAMPSCSVMDGPAFSPDTYAALDRLLLRPVKRELAALTHNSLGPRESSSLRARNMRRRSRAILPL